MRRGSAWPEPTAGGHARRPASKAGARSVVLAAPHGSVPRLEPLPAGYPLRVQRDRGDVAAQRRAAVPAEQPAALGERSEPLALVDADAGGRRARATRLLERGRGHACPPPSPVPPCRQGDRPT